MRRLLWAILIATQGLGNSPAFALSNSDILGQWRYDGFFYDGHRYPNPNPELELTFTFTADGRSHYFWKRQNETGSCERIAEYKVTEQQLWQKVIWVNPQNSAQCSQDPDMRMGRETVTVVSLQEPELQFHFDLNGKPFLYILKRTLPAGSN